jgi:hypothetical protein
MAVTPEETIRAAAQAYIAGDEDGLRQLLDEGVRVLGSEQRDNWDGRDHVLQRMGKELGRRRNIELSVSGSLIDAVDALESVDQQAGLAWWSCTGDLDVDGAYHRETSWTVVLRRWGEEDDSDWRIIHSHFSIHR